MNFFFDVSLCARKLPDKDVQQPVVFVQLA